MRSHAFSYMEIYSIEIKVNFLNLISALAEKDLQGNIFCSLLIVIVIDLFNIFVSKLISQINKGSVRSFFI